MKQKAKKAASAAKVDKLKTGGGTTSVVESDLDQKVLSMLGNRGTPLPNPYDSDALFNGEIGW